ncbi:ribulose-phosphate 3-epimerase [Porcipelethomonas sp.]|uniref:ribulose-phosphate 3-epimerase n=1 Tax=Porcipelethomonas sp. TaxID=2981675 RepID=UPI003EF482DB
MKNQVSVSILSADFLELKTEIDKIEKSNADMLHFDVMDGVFVPNISFGFPILETVNKYTDMHLDVHLMIINPVDYIEQCVRCGADTVTIHLECDSDIAQTIKMIKKSGVKAGLSIKPSTPFESVIPYLDKIDMLLIMTVEPGFGGQSFISDMLNKISSAKKYIDEHNLNVSIQVDGGINEKTGKLASDAGADILVAGSYIFKNGSVTEAVASLAGQ